MRPLQCGCFVCRKSFKRPEATGSVSRFMTSPQRAGQEREAHRRHEERAWRCPDCGGPIRFMGLDFKAPKRSDVGGWRKAEAFTRDGEVYHRGTR